VELGLAVADGALIIPDVLGAGPMELVVPQPDDPWRLREARVGPAGMELEAVVDVDALVRD